ncbi:MAG: hypothetical protein WBC22_07190 [Sedimentisphaerales bacterium]
MTVIVITAIAVVAMFHFKDVVNRSEAMRAVDRLRQRIKQYRDEYGSVPPESWIGMQRENLPGSARLGDLQYRGLWIDPDSTPDEILAYAERDYYSLFVGKGYIVLRLGAVLVDDGRVEWIDMKEFKTLLSQQQSPEEIQMLQK